MSSLIRVGALQFGVQDQLGENLEKSLYWIDKALSEGCELIVTPEFVNHICWYRDSGHCHEVALSSDDLFLQAVSDRARKKRAYIVVNVTMRDDQGDGVTGSSLLFGPNGLMGRSDKHVLIGHENDFLKKGVHPPTVVQTPLGAIGLYACMEGVLPEIPRALAVQGADILCNSLNSFATCEAHLHIPVRAAENKVFMVAANKVGPLIPEDQLDPVAAAINIPQRFLYGAGESQVVDPMGAVLRRATVTEEGVIAVDIDPSLAGFKTRPNGFHILRDRSPAITSKLSQRAVAPELKNELLTCRIIQPPKNAGEIDRRKLGELIGESLDAEDALIVLPQLFFYHEDWPKDPKAAAEASQEWLPFLMDALKGAESLICTSMIQALDANKDGDRFAHTAVLVSSRGVVHSQGQMQMPAARGKMWQTANELNLYDSPWGSWALLTGDDGHGPEAFRVAALKGASLFIVPFASAEPWENEFGLLERSCENRVPMIVANRADAVGQSMFLQLEKDFTLMTSWQSRVFDGYINYPKVTRMAKGQASLKQTLDLGPARDKVLSHRTHVLEDRAWGLNQYLVSKEPPL